MTPGKTTSEFKLTVGICLLALVRGLDITNGAISYHFPDSLVPVLAAVIGLYTVSRTAGKITEHLKKPAASKEEVKQAINELYDERKGE